jgi:hypothetical protein
VLTTSLLEWTVIRQGLGLREEDVVSRSWVGGLVKEAYSPVVPKGTGAHPLEVGIGGEEGVVKQPTAPAYGAQPMPPDLRRRRLETHP